MAVVSGGLQYICFSNATCTLRNLEHSNEGWHRRVAQQKCYLLSLGAYASHAETSREETGRNEKILTQEHHQN